MRRVDAEASVGDQHEEDHRHAEAIDAGDRRRLRIESAPSSGLIVRSSTTLSSTGSLPERERDRELVGALDGEAAADPRLAAEDRLVDERRGDDLVVEDDREAACPTLSCVTVAKRRAPPPSKLDRDARLAVCWSKLLLWHRPACRR